MICRVYFVKNENVFKTTVIMFFNSDHHKTLHVCAQSLFYLKLIISVKCTTCLVDQIKIGLINALAYLGGAVLIKLYEA